MFVQSCSLLCNSPNHCVHSSFVLYSGIDIVRLEKLWAVQHLAQLGWRFNAVAIVSSFNVRIRHDVAYWLVAYDRLHDAAFDMDNNCWLHSFEFKFANSPNNSCALLS